MRPYGLPWLRRGDDAAPCPEGARQGNGHGDPAFVRGRHKRHVPEQHVRGALLPLRLRDRGAYRIRHLGTPSSLQGREDVTTVAFAGDGGTFDIGLQSLSGAADRNDNFIYVCLDNEAYMNTGIQSSSSTPQNTWTMTTPGGRRGRKKKFMQIIAAHRMPYAATASIGHPEDLMEKVKKAKATKGMKFLHVLTPCSTGWRMPEHMSARAAQLAVETRIFPLYEVIDGSEYRITHEPKGLPVDEYTRIQGRFRHFTPADVTRLQNETDAEWALLKGLVKGCKA